MRWKVNKFHKWIAMGVALAVVIPAMGGFLYVNHGKNSSFSPGIAILINNDPEVRHQENLEAAVQALKRYGFRKILAYGRDGKIPTVREICFAVEEIHHEGGKIDLLYLTGHGSLLLDGTNSTEEPCIMLKEDPLEPKQLVDWLGTGPAVVYMDQCYAPQWGEALRKFVSGDILILTDKHAENPQASCRGVSTRFWSRVEAGAARGDYLNEMNTAWMEACPHGSRWVIGHPGDSLKADSR